MVLAQICLNSEYYPHKTSISSVWQSAGHLSKRCHLESSIFYRGALWRPWAHNRNKRPRQKQDFSCWPGHVCGCEYIAKNVNLPKNFNFKKTVRLDFLRNPLKTFSDYFQCYHHAMGGLQNSQNHFCSLTSRWPPGAVLGKKVKKVYFLCQDR